MGGLWKHIPVTFGTMTIATLAISGIFPFAGFFSKDEILWRDYQANWVYWFVGLVTAFLTAFYMFRLLFMTFFGEYRGPAGASHGQEEQAGHGTHLGRDEAATQPALSLPTRAPAAHDETHGHGHGHGGIHESPWVMLAPLVILALLSIFGGWVGWPRPLGGLDRFDTFLRPAFETSAPAANAEYGRSEEAAPPEPATEGSERQPGRTEVILAVVSLATAVFGGLLAWLFYCLRPDLPDRIAASAHGLYSAVANKYWIDELYGWLFVKPLIAISTVVFWRGIDQGVIDATVDGSAEGARELSNSVRHMQSGNVRSYAAWVAIGATAVIAYMLWVATR
jgi:NADH-quinone oxidoreductase subunit L